MIRLGHIDYSNCIPVHALLLDRAVPGIGLVRGVPADLNRALAAGEIDAAPCSSIEYARHSGEYRLLPGHVIGSRGAVGSILLESAVPATGLGGTVIGVPTASATSVVLLRALLEIRLGLDVRLEWFDQGSDSDPVDHGMAAALRIGDTALRRSAPPGRTVLDLGAEWESWTGLPFAFAVWQVRREVDAGDVRNLADILDRSRTYFAAHTEDFATRCAPDFGLTPARLLAYWASLQFDLDDAMSRGLLRFYELAAELGEAPPVAGLEFTGT
jgi:chorismate dehydratase